MAQRPKPAVIPCPPEGSTLQMVHGPIQLPDSLATSPSSADSEQRWLGGYRILRTLGQGGLGTVYLAVEEGGLPIALKTFRLLGDDSGNVTSAFERESALGGRLDHPDIVKVLDTGVNGDIAFIAMEFVPGHDLSRHTSASSRLPLALTLRTVERVAIALASAHALGIVHRDIKPANVLVHWPTNTVKVADFGLARLGDVFRSRTGIVSGTPSYMSPEQLAEGAVGPGSDLYSLGVVMFELLAGQLPHESTSLGALLQQVASVPAPDLRLQRPDLPSGLASLVNSLLQKRVVRRPSDALEVARELARLRAELPLADQGGAGGPMSRP